MVHSIIRLRRFVRRAAFATGLALAFGTMSLIGCNGKICEKAAKQYTGCVQKILGPEMAKMAKSKQGAGIEACKKDKATQKMYKKCLPQKDCNKFMKCLEDYARKHGP